MQNKKQNHKVVKPVPPPESEDVGVPTLFQPGEWDQAEELENNEALREHLREQQEQF